MTENSKITKIDHGIAQRLRGLREASVFSQPDVAKFLGMKYQSYQKIEGGRVSLRASTVVQLAAFFSVPVSQILGTAEPSDMVCEAMLDEDRRASARIWLLILGLPRSKWEAVKDYIIRLKRDDDGLRRGAAADPQAGT